MIDLAMDEQSTGGNRSNFSDSNRSTVAVVTTSIPIASIIIMIIAGNGLVIVAVLRDKSLKRQAQNWLIVSLAAADLLVGMVIMPLSLSYELLGFWPFGQVLCELWLALDVLFVTASILNLCAISLDRYWSLTDPLRYPHQRTKKRMMMMIAAVWLLAGAISFPPLVGWRAQQTDESQCAISKERGYIIYSALGSFYLPVLVLLFVYARIFCITRRRAKRKSVSSAAGVRPADQSAAGGGSSSDDVMVVKANGDDSHNHNHNNHHHHHHHQQPDGGQTQNGHTPAVLSASVGSQKSGQNRRNHSHYHQHKLRNATAPTPTPTPTPTPIPPPFDDYAVLVARVRAMAVGAQIGYGSTAECRTDDHPRLSMVTAVAAAAAAHSRQHPNPNATRAYELQKQLMNRRKLVRKRERQANVVLSLVLCTFIGSWLPFFSSYILSAADCKTPDLLFAFIFWLGYCNSAINPVIYNIYNRDFRRAFHKILCGRRARRRADAGGSKIRSNSTKVSWFGKSSSRRQIR